ncbi:MAG TPA: NAD(P)-binding domain-containing protein [Polyangiaceae bacterium]|nr:NAD(P)-binding domain-containing protein [Polyangiaceae bacterium]
MKLGIIGTGGVGRALGVLLSRQGHELYFGARDLDAAREAAAAAGGRFGNFEAAARFGEVLVYTLRSGPDPYAEPSAGARGTIVVDCRGAGAFDPKAPRGAPGARVVRAFFDVPQEALDLADAVPLCEYGAPFLLCGDDAGAKAAVASLAEQLGFAPVDCGPLDHARIASALGGAIYALARRAPVSLAAERAAAGWLAAA